MKTTTSDSARPSAGELSLFLSKYSARLLGAGATCIRLEKNAARIAKAYGKEAEISIMPRHVHLSVWAPGSADTGASIAAIGHPAISFRINTKLSELSWEIADGKVDFATAAKRFDRIVRDDRRNPRTVLFLVALANASFCRLFGGDFIAMTTVCLATAAGYHLKLLLLGRGVDIRLTALVCAFASAVLGATDTLFSIGETPSVASGTSVLYLVPGIPFLNSFSDLLYRHYLCAFSRFVDALVLTCSLSIGLCAGMLLMNIRMF